MANIIQINGKKVKDANAARMSSLAPVESSTTASMAHAVGDYFWLNGTLYEATAAITIGNAISVGTNCKITNMGENLADLKTAIANIEDALTGVTGKLLPPEFALGSRYVSNGADTWASNIVRMSFKQGTYINLKQGDVVKKTSNTIYTFSGGYSTDGGTTFTTILNGSADYTAPADGLYFFCLAKQNDATFSEDELDDGWKYIGFFTSETTMESRLSSAESDIDTVDNNLDDVKVAIDYEVGPITPTEYYTLTNTGKGLTYLGELTDDSGQDASDYIAIDDLYDICRIVPNKTKYGLGSICYYTSTKQFIAPRVQPGTSYDFSIYNGETVVWLGIDKTVSNAKYVRFCAENNRNYKYWVVKNGPQASVLDDYAKQSFLGKKIVNFGDSIFGLTRPPKDVSSYLAAKTGATVYNAGFGGCEMSAHADSNYDPFSMYNLATAIATGVWTTQESAASASGMPAYFAETVALLKTIDFSTIDIATISYGTNDWNNSSPLDNGGNSNMAYFADALRYSIETILTAYPNIRLFLCTPTYRFWMDGQGQFTEDSNTKINSTTNLKLTDFVNKTIAVAAEYQLPCINDYDIGMNRYNRAYYFYSTDGTHPKPEGNKLIADNIANKIY